MGTLVILEGGDGSGKATQTQILKERLEKEGYRVMAVSFPDYGSPSSALVKMYLAGEFGKEAGDVSPYVASTFYAADRYASFRMKWKAFYDAGGIVLADRYTTRIGKIVTIMSIASPDALGITRDINMLIKNVKDITK